MRAFDLAWSILKQYTPPAGAERMPRPHPYGGDMSERPDLFLRDPPDVFGFEGLSPEGLRRGEAILDLHRRLLDEAPIQTHGPLPPDRLIPTQRKHAGKNMMDMHQPRIYQPHVPAPYYTAEYAPRYEAMYYDSPDYLFDDAPTGGR